MLPIGLIGKGLTPWKIPLLRTRAPFCITPGGTAETEGEGWSAPRGAEHGTSPYTTLPAGIIHSPQHVHVCPARAGGTSAHPDLPGP